MTTPGGRESRIPRVFVSATHADLEEYRDVVGEVVLKSGLMPVLSRYWPAAGGAHPLDRCLREVSGCDLLIAIVAHLYGWVPPGQPEGEHKSITRLECERAAEEGKEVLAFILHDDAPWPLESREEHRFVTVGLGEEQVDVAAEFASIRRSVAELRAFKVWLKRLGIIAGFRSTADLRYEVIAALNEWRLRHELPDRDGGADLEEADTSKMLRSLWEQTRFIDIRGLHVGSGKANRFPIEDLYIPLMATTGAANDDAETASAGGPVAEGRGETRAFLRHRRLVILGDPGSGKTTFLRRTAHVLAASLLRIDADAASERLGMTESVPMPILFRLSDLEAFLSRGGGESSAGSGPGELPGRLVDFLRRASVDDAWGLSREFFQKKLESGDCALLLDGLDEVPTEDGRRPVRDLIREVARTYPQCRIIVTSRPKAYGDEVALREFEHLRVAPLSERSIDVFLRHWCRALFPDAPAQAEAHRRELNRALESRPMIRRMAANPVMLTALAVVHWNEKRVPEQRADLYESIVTWLARSRIDRPGRPPVHRCIFLLQEVALAMQTDPGGRRVEYSRRAAAEHLARMPDFAGGPGDPVERAAQFLADEELDSGIIVRRGEDLRFWHLSFQEFLAGRALVARSEQEQKDLLLSDPGRLFSSEWRETVLLFAGILHSLGPQKVDALIRQILDSATAPSPIPMKARVIGLIGAINRDLASLNYRVSDPRHERMMEEVIRVSKAGESESIDLNLRLEAADAIGFHGDHRLSEWRWVPIDGGRFTVGVQVSDPSAPGYDAWAFSAEAPPRELILEPFLVALYPVTVGEFEQFIADEGYQCEPYWEAGGFGIWRRPEQWESQAPYSARPVVGVSWYEACAYCRWKGEGVRLLSEAQWERCARGTDDRRYPWGDVEPDAYRLNYAASALGRPTPIGFYPRGATPDGLFDLAGNVLEWCQDLYGDDRARSAPSSSGSDRRDGDARVVRGGSFRNVAYFARTTARGGYRPGYRGNFIGFRIGRAAGPATVPARTQ